MLHRDLLFAIRYTLSSLRVRMDLYKLLITRLEASIRLIENEDCKISDYRWDSSSRNWILSLDTKDPDTNQPTYNIPTKGYCREVVAEIVSPTVVC